MVGLDERLKGLRRAAALTAIVLAALFALWSALAPISSATVATGIVSPDTGRKTVQHLEGGIVERILVAEGDVVAEGQPLVVLVDAKARASHQTQLHRRAELLLQIARLKALAGEAGEPDFSGLAEELGDPSLAAFAENERALFVSRKATLAAKTGTIRDDLRSLDAAVQSFTAQLAATAEELRLIREERETKSYLLTQGLTTKPVVLALDRRRTQIEAQIAQLESQRLAQRSAIEQKRKAIEGELSAFHNEVAGELSKAETDLAAVIQQIGASADAIRRMDVRAPEAGTVVSLRLRTPGAVLAPGAPIADLVPVSGATILDVRVKPNDIARVHAGQPAQVMLTAYSAREVPFLPAVVKTVSADAVTDPNTREIYYKAELRIDRDAIARLAPQVALVAGMPVEGYIAHHQRTLVEWLLEPVVRSFRRGGVEY
jgi:HlyD family type I secretion membrane fusion protein